MKQVNLIQADRLREYQTIQSKSQLERYTDEFNRIYPQYEELRSYVESLAKHSATQQAELEHIGEKNSKEFKEKSLEIIQDYLRLQQDTSHTVRVDRYQYLEAKLGRIRELIRQYELSNCFH